MKFRHIILALCTALLASCHSIQEWDNDAQGNFDALWTIVDEHYCFFQQKDIDWAAIHDHYQQRIYPGMSSAMLFNVCADMLAELRDGHVNLSSWFNTSYYSRWWTDYPQNYDERLVEQYYLHFGAKHLGGVDYAILQQNVGYIRYPSFTYSLGESNLDAILNEFALCKGIIIDIRDNGGGNLTYAEDLIRRFLTERTIVGYMVNKTGPGHDDFSKPWEYYYEPIGSQHLSWIKPVVVLTNRSTFSAANNFVSIVQFLPNVTICGARTGGGSGMPINMELPCGWNVRLSSVSVLDARGRTTEFGIDPTPGCEVDLDPVLALSGIDTMLEKAISIILQ